MQNLSFGFRNRRLFSDVSLDVRAGEVMHLLGPNGAGKSTFMAILAGLMTPDSGEIEFHADGSAVDDRRSYVEYLPAEANGLYLKMDATLNLAFWAALRGRSLSREQAFAALARWNLDHPLLRDGFPVEKFSTGMKRRLALARLELSPAPLWLLDEPLYGLDHQAVAGFRELMREHLQRGGLALVVSHDKTAFDGFVTREIDLSKPAPPSAASATS